MLVVYISSGQSLPHFVSQIVVQVTVLLLCRPVSLSPLHPSVKHIHRRIPVGHQSSRTGAPGGGPGTRVAASEQGLWAAGCRREQRVKDFAAHGNAAAAKVCLQVTLTEEEGRLPVVTSEQICLKDVELKLIKTYFPKIYVSIMCLRDS